MVIIRNLSKTISCRDYHLKDCIEWELLDSAFQEELFKTDTTE